MALAAVSLAGCSDSESVASESAPTDTAAAPVTDVVPPPIELEDAEIEDWRIELLDMAFTGVSEMPLDPHIKNRSRAQDQIVVACVELDQPARALRYAEQIANWRRGSGFADLAWYALENEQSGVERLMDMAEQVVRTEETGPTGQKWRRDRVLAKMARVWSETGEQEKALAILAGVEESEKVTVQLAEARHFTSDDVDAIVASNEAAAATGRHELLEGMLLTSVEVYGNVYEDVSARESLAESVRGMFASIPTNTRVDMVLDMAESARAHGDLEEAAKLAKEARDLFVGSKWSVAFYTEMMAKTAVARFHAGETDAARGDLDATFAVFQERKLEEPDMFRAQAMLPLAEAYDEIGATGRALECYLIAAEDSVLNVNARPQAMDMAAIHCSLAVQGVEPDDALWAQLRENREELGKLGW